jgi:hypothetical protein
MARPQNVRLEEPAEKVIPIADPEAETVGSPGSVTKRPFVLDKRRGSGGGNMPLMLMVLGAMIIFGIGMVAFLSSKGTTKRRRQPKLRSRTWGESPEQPPPET